MFHMTRLTLPHFNEVPGLIYQARKVSGHLHVCWGYIFCLSFCEFSIYLGTVPTFGIFCLFFVSYNDCSSMMSHVCLFGLCQRLLFIMQVERKTRPVFVMRSYILQQYRKRIVSDSGLIGSRPYHGQGNGAKYLTYNIHTIISQFCNQSRSLKHVICFTIHG